MTIYDFDDSGVEVEAIASQVSVEEAIGGTVEVVPNGTWLSEDFQGIRPSTAIFAALSQKSVLRSPLSLSDPRTRPWGDGQIQYFQAVGAPVAWASTPAAWNSTPAA